MFAQYGVVAAQDIEKLGERCAHFGACKSAAGHDERQQTLSLDRIVHGICLLEHAEQVIAKFQKSSRSAEDVSVGLEARDLLCAIFYAHAEHEMIVTDAATAAVRS